MVRDQGRAGAVQHQRYALRDLPGRQSGLRPGGKSRPLEIGRLHSQGLASDLAAGLRSLSASEVKEYVLANAGARPWDRDAMDRRIIQQVRDGTGKIPDSDQEVGGYPNLPENRHAFDDSQWDLATMTSR